MQFAYGTNKEAWGAPGSTLAAGVNLYAEHLKAPRPPCCRAPPTSTACSPPATRFSTLGGIALAVRQLDGQAPELYIEPAR